MRTEKEIRTHKKGDAAPTRPEELWLDPDIPPEHLIRLDPLDITEEIVQKAQQPELANFEIWILPEGR